MKIIIFEFMYLFYAIKICRYLKMETWINARNDQYFFLFSLEIQEKVANN